MENDHDEKENINFVNGTNGNFDESSASSDGPNDSMHNGDYEAEQKISVKERMQKFNRIASESELANKMPSRSKREIAAKVRISTCFIYLVTTVFLMKTRNYNLSLINLLNSTSPQTLIRHHYPR